MLPAPLPAMTQRQARTGSLPAKSDSALSVSAMEQICSATIKERVSVATKVNRSRNLPEMDTLSNTGLSQIHPVSIVILCRKRKTMRLLRNHKRNRTRFLGDAFPLTFYENHDMMNKNIFLHYGGKYYVDMSELPITE